MFLKGGYIFSQTVVKVIFGRIDLLLPVSETKVSDWSFEKKSKNTQLGVPQQGFLDGIKWNYGAL